MLRSEQMSLCQIFIPQGVGYFVMADLGEVGLIQFKDMNSHVNLFQRRFAAEVGRFGMMEFRLQMIANHLKKFKIPLEKTTQNPPVLRLNKITDLQFSIKHSASEVEKLMASETMLKKEYLNLVQLKHVLAKTDAFYLRHSGNLEVMLLKKSSQSSLEEGQSNARHLEVICGIIDRERVVAFETMVWRISLTNVFFRISPLMEPIVDPFTGAKMYKNVFVICCQGGEMEKRIRKVCTGFHTNVYDVPRDPEERMNVLNQVTDQIEALESLIAQTHQELLATLTRISRSIEYWNIVVLKMKAVFHMLNNLNVDVSDKMFIGECWVCSNELPNVQQLLIKSSNAAGGMINAFINPMKVTEEPPTLNLTNKFTQAFQNLIDSYGMASYREVNPAVYALVTFPFLFAVMFGDLGHAIILTGCSLVLIVQEKRIGCRNLDSEVFNIFFAGRYLIFLMGCFSMYTGLLYNDIFSKSVNFFGSSWYLRVSDVNRSLSVDYMQLHPKWNYRGTPYIMGVDPLWHSAKNDIVFNNSFKMKLSIIIGVSHMVLGLCVNLVNYLHFKHYYKIFLDFIPQLVILSCLFIYLVVLIFLKWCLYNAETTNVTRGTSCAPSVLTHFIHMLLFKSNDIVGDCRAYMYRAQPWVQYGLVTSVAIFIPILLMGKPIYMKRRRLEQDRKKLELWQQQLSHWEEEDTTSRRMDMNDADKERRLFELRRASMYFHNINEHNEFYDYMSQDDLPDPTGEQGPQESTFETAIYQIIHTVEFVLGTVSHTSSYLRLWALSLAHSQLSHVLWEKVLRFGLTSSSIVAPLFIVFSFFIWCIFTVVVLIVMEGLSAFLHTLRLHWVEFMSKFYSGNGYPFQPFSFKKLVEEHSSVKHDY